MNHSQFIFSKTMLDIGSVISLQWPGLIILLIFCCGVPFVFYLLQLRNFRNRLGSMESIIIEKTELLSYAQDKMRTTATASAQATELRSHLITKINHELRTPLNGVLGMTALLEKTTLNSEQEEYAEVIRQSGEQLLLTINDILMNDILDNSKLDKSGAELEQREINLRNCVEDVLDMFSIKSARKKIELLYSIDDKVPDVIIGDWHCLRQVLINLLENSITFSDAGFLCIEIKMGEQAAGGRQELKFTVIDSGKGIEPAQLSALNDKLANDSPAPVNVQKKTGMGLLLCGRLVSRMGGSLSLHNLAEGGTAARFNLWCNTTASPRRIELSGAARLVGKRVLLIEANPYYGQLLTHKLSSLNMESLCVKNNAELTALLQSGDEPDLVLMDAGQDKEQAAKMCEVLKELRPSLPVIGLLYQPEIDEWAEPELFISMMAKPVRLNLLVDHMLFALNEKNTDKNEAANNTDEFSVEFAQKYPLRILVAEDNLINQQLAGMILSKLGYEPQYALNGKEVLNKVSHFNYDLILMDVQMPEMDGLEAARMIRICLTNQPVIIAMTANSMQEDREEYLNNGMDDYISKPIDLDELIRLLRKWAQHISERK